MLIILTVLIVLLIIVVLVLIVIFVLLLIYFLLFNHSNFSIYFIRFFNNLVCFLLTFSLV